MLSGGEIKCWTANYDKHKTHFSNTTSANSKFALLHTFKGHTDAVTCITLHSVSGLAISASLDGTIKILNLEYLTEFYTVTLNAGITELKLLRVHNSYHNNHNQRHSEMQGCLFSLTDGSIKLWHITSCTEYFGVVSAAVVKIEAVSNMHIPFPEQVRLTTDNLFLCVAVL